MPIRDGTGDGTVVIIQLRRVRGPLHLVEAGRTELPAALGWLLESKLGSSSGSPVAEPEDDGTVRWKKRPGSEGSIP